MAGAHKLSALAHKRIEQLTAGFTECVHCFRKTQPFTGPSVYFYEQTLRRGRELGLYGLRDDRRFAELAYATLTAWGMHRMGPVVTKLPDFATFRQAIRQLVPQLESTPRSILDVCHDLNALEALIAKCSALAADRTLTRAKSPLVVNAKLMHFIVPDLIPPIDRSYTLRFFYNAVSAAGPTEDIFAAVYGGCSRIAALNQKNICALLCHDGYMSSSHGKIIDNAIVGFVRAGFRLPAGELTFADRVTEVSDADSYESDGHEPADIEALYDEETHEDEEEEEHDEDAIYDEDRDEWIGSEDDDTESDEPENDGWHHDE
jgi:hypothetical protein